MKEQLLLAAALQLFTELGFHGTPTSKIAKTAGVSNGTLFHYFATKDILIVHLYRSIKIELNQYLEQHLQPTAAPLDNIKIYFYKSIEWAVQHPQKFQYIQQFLNAPFYKTIDAQDATIQGTHTALLESAKAQNQLADLPTDLLFTLISYSIFGVIDYLQHHQGDSATVLQKSYTQVLKMIT